MVSQADIELIGQAIAHAGFFMIVIAVIGTWVIQVLLRPRTRQEWAEFCKITAFAAMVLLILWRWRTGMMLSELGAAIFWTASYFLVGFYAIVLLENWTFPFLGIGKRILTTYETIAILAISLAGTTALIYYILNR